MLPSQLKLPSQKTKNLLAVYYTAGYPCLEDTIAIGQQLAEKGVDILEIGMPYSDPLADGPTIQSSGAKALSNGMTLPLLLEQLQSLRATIDTPILLMGYYNQMLQYGPEKFFREAAAAGADGFILPDLPPDEYEEAYRPLFTELGLSISFLITPQTPEPRIQYLASLSSAFLYVVSTYAITGGTSSFSENTIQYLQRVQAMQLPNLTMVGFGISTQADLQLVQQYAHGGIIGSAFLKAIGQPGDLKTLIDGFFLELGKEL